MRRYLVVAICTAVGLAGGGAWVLLHPANYTSRAVMVIRPSTVSERDVPGQARIELPHFILRVTQICQSRAVLLNLIQSYDLYASKRRRLPMEDVIEDMRKDIVVQSTADSVSIAFTYSGDRDVAQKVTSGLSTQFLHNFMRERSTDAHFTRELLHDSAETAATDWAKLSEQARAKPNERMLLDRDLARKQYVELRSRLAEIELLDELHKRHLGSTLEMLDPPSLPQSPDIKPAMVIGLSTLSGLVLGLLAFFIRGLRWRRMGFAIPAA